MKLFYLGTCSGTEPIAGTHHCSFVLETGGINYWFEAGENCVHRAVESGIDVMRTAALFVSHPHIDHIGGLANLLSCINKRYRRYQEHLVRDDTLEVFFPDLPLLHAIQAVSCGSTAPRFHFRIAEHATADGLLFSDENLQVTALHNTHLKEDGSHGWHSHSFRIDTEGRHLVFSGDVRSPEELDPLIGSGCDMLIMETGHHRVEDVLEYALSRHVKNLRFIHHGRQILEHREEAERLCAAVSAENPICVRILRDGDQELF